MNKLFLAIAIFGLVCLPFFDAVAGKMSSRITEDRTQQNAAPTSVDGAANNQSSSINPDLNGDCILSYADVSAFITAFQAQDSIVDYDDNNMFDLNDVNQFINTFQSMQQNAVDLCPSGNNLHDANNGLPVGEAKYQVLVKSNYYGTLDMEGLHEFHVNEDFTVNMMPNPGFKVERVMINGEPREVNGNSFTFYDVNGYAHVDVVFEPDNFVQQIYVDGNLNAACEGNYSVAMRSCGGADGTAVPNLQAAADLATAGTHVIVREGTYRDVGTDGGSRGFIGMRVKHSGTMENPVLFSPYEDERVVLDGAREINDFQACTSASDCLNNPNWQNIYKADLSNNIDIPSAFVFRDDGEEIFRVASSPSTEEENAFNPNKITDAWHYFPRDHYIMSGDRIAGIIDQSVIGQYNQSQIEAGYVYHWGCNNNVKLMGVQSYDPDTGELLFDETINCAPRDDGGAFKLYNMIEAMDEPGEYYIDEARGEFYVMVDDELHLANVEHGYWNKGIHLNGHEHIIIKGFEFTGITDKSLGGEAIVNYNSGNGYEVSHISVLDNEFYNLVGGAMNVSGSYYGFYGYNNVHDTGLGRAIKPDGGPGNIIVGNDLARVGRTGISYYGATDSFIIGNTNRDSLGQHSNGITTYLSCDNILVFKNTVVNSQISLTMQSSKNIHVIGNVFVNEGSKAIAAWNSNDPAENITFIGNTVIGSTYVHPEDWRGEIIYHDNIMETISEATQRSHNLHIDLPWWMPDDFDYGAYNESLEEDLYQVFANPETYELTPRDDVMGSPLVNPCTMSTSGGHVGAIGCE